MNRYTAAGVLADRRANGEERILAVDGVGQVQFRSVRSCPRGLTFDVVVFDSLYPEQDAVKDALLIVAASPVGEVMRP